MRRFSTVIAMTLRSGVKSVLMLSVLAATAFLAGCGWFGDSDTKCGVDGACRVTLDREKDATVEVAGIDIKLIKVEGDLVTLEVGGQQIVVPKGEEGESSDAQVAVEKITETEVVLKVQVI